MQLNATSTQRELAAYRAMTSPCMGCHSNFDRFGLLLEQYDAIGKHLPAQAMPVDFTGLSPLDGTAADVASLTQRFERDQLFEKCFADRTFGYALTAAADSNRMCLGNLRDPVKLQSATIRDVVVAIATSPLFNARTGEL
jgi:hypothetical protein